MKQIFAFFIILFAIILLGVFGYFYKNSKSTPTENPPTLALSPTKQIVFTSAPEKPIVTQTSFCKPTDVQASIVLSPGAGNIYGTLKLQNTSAAPCQIIGNNPIKASSSAQNITITYTGPSHTTTILLSPQQSAYSQIHYPNGPQCQTGIKTSTISFRYAFSITDSILFRSPQGYTLQNITTCSSLNEPTQVQIWNLSDKPITPGA